MVFLDTDIVMLRDPIPYFLSRGADLWGSMEKCMIYSDRLAHHTPEFLSLKRKFAPINIGVLFFRATAGVTRCVYNWCDPVLLCVLRSLLRNPLQPSADMG